MEYYKPTLSGVFIKRAHAQAGKPPVYNFDIFFWSDISTETKRYMIFCLCELNELHFVSKAPNGINEEKRYEHVCSINSVIIGSCESLFISILQANLAQWTDEK